jgi:ATP-dependent DNA helicase RecQ
MAASGSDAVLRSGGYGVLRRCLEEKPQGRLQDIERHKLLNAMGAFAEAQTCRVWCCSTTGEGRQEPAATAISASIRRNSTMA